MLIIVALQFYFVVHACIVILVWCKRHVHYWEMILLDIGWNSNLRNYMSTVECTFLVIRLSYLVQVCTSFFKPMFAYLIMIADTDWKYSNQQIVFATWLMLTAPSTYQWRVLSSDQLSWLLNYVNISLITFLSFYFPGNLQGPEFRNIKSNYKHITNFHAHTDFSWDWSLLHFIL
jgi:hypothetical protein